MSSSTTKSGVDGSLPGVKQSSSSEETKITETGDMSGDTSGLESLHEKKDNVLLALNASGGHVGNEEVGLSEGKDSINVTGAALVGPEGTKVSENDEEKTAPADISDKRDGKGENLDCVELKDALDEMGENLDNVEVKGPLDPSLDAPLQEAGEELQPTHTLEAAFDPNNREAPYPGSTDTVTTLGNLLVSHLEEKMRDMPIQESTETHSLSIKERQDRLKKILDLAVQDIGPHTDTARTDRDHVSHAEAFDPENRQAPYPGSSDNATTLASLMIHFFEEKIKSEPPSVADESSSLAGRLLPAQEGVLKSFFDVLDEYILIDIDSNTADSSHQFVTHEAAFDPDNRPAPYPGSSTTAVTLSSLLLQHLDEKVKSGAPSDTEERTPTSANQVSYDLEDVIQSIIKVLDEFQPETNATRNEPDTENTQSSEFEEAFDPDNREAPYPGSSDTSVSLTGLLVRQLEQLQKNSPKRSESVDSSEITDSNIFRLKRNEEKDLVAILVEAQQEIDREFNPP